MFTVPPKYHNTSIIYIVLLNVVMLGATCALFYTTRNSEINAVQDKFYADSVFFVQTLEEELWQKETTLSNFQTYLGGQNSVSSEDFQAFINLQDDTFSNWMMGWIPAELTPAMKSSLTIKQWDTEQNRWIESDAPPASPIVFVGAGENDSSIAGHNLGSHPELNKAIQQATLSRESIALPNPASLLDDSPNAEVIVIDPIWGAGNPNSASETAGNTDILIGYAVGIIHMNQLLIDGIQSQNFRDISIEINDTTSLINQNTLFSNQFDRAIPFAPPLSPYSDQFMFGKTDWHIRVIPNENFVQQRQGVLSWSILLGGILVSLIVNGLTWFMVFETYAIREQVIERTEALNSTNELLWTSTNELNKTKTLLKTKIKENEQFEEDLAKAQTQLAHSKETIDQDFIETLSREIRVPTNGMMGMAEMLNKTPLDTEQIGFVQTIKTSGQSLLSTINDVLDFTKMESGDLSIVSAPFDLRRMLEEALEWVAFNAYEKPVELILEIDPSVPEWVEADERRFHQIVSNVLSDALSHTDTGEVSIQVNASQERDQTLLSIGITDSGEPISDDELDLLFEPSEADAKSIRSQFLANRFSLGVSKKIAEILGGDIVVMPGDAQGNLYNITLLVHEAEPLNQDHTSFEINTLSEKSCLVVMSNKRLRQLVSNYLEEWDMVSNEIPSAESGLKMFELSAGKHDLIIYDGDSSSFTPQQFVDHLKMSGYPIPPIVAYTTLNRQQNTRTNEYPEIIAWLYKPVKKIPLYHALTDYFLQTQFAPPNYLSEIRRYDPQFHKAYPLEILLAEDNPINQKIAVNTLNQLGYTVDFVSNGIEAMDRVVRKQYDLVLMDIQMPRMSGIHAIKGIKRSVNRNLAVKPVVIGMTSSIRQDEKDACIKAGANGFILKPFQIDHLVQMLKDVHHYKMSRLSNGKQKENSLIKPTARLNGKVVSA